MSLPIFDHATFGRPQTDGHGYQQQPRNRRLGVMDGAPRYRLTAPSAPVSINVTWTMTDQKLLEFRHWLYNDLNKGASWFIMELMLGTGRSGSEFDSNSFRQYEVHFQNEPQVAWAGYNWWQVSATLEIRHSDQYSLVPPDPSAQRLSDHSDASNEYSVEGQVFVYNAATGDFRNRTLFAQAGGYIDPPSEMSLSPAPEVPHKFEVIDLAVFCGGGSGTCSGLISGTVIEGLDGVVFDSNQERVYAASGLNDMLIGDDLQFRVDLVSSAVDLMFRFKLRLAGF